MLAVVSKMDATPQTTATFADFWLLYPKRVARKEAERAWQRLTDLERIEALVGLVKWREVWIARGEMQFTPNPATWLNGERWSDDLPSEWLARPNHASHTAFTAKPAVELGPREIPASVREAIAKLRR